MDIKDEITNSKKIAIFSHINPDADAICSCVALKTIIRNNFEYKIVDVFLDGEIGDIYRHLVRDEVINPEPQNSYDLAFVLDSPNLDRIGQYKSLAENCSKIFNIDHHETNTRFGALNMVPKKVSSTCEFLYFLCKKYNFDLNRLIAQELYQGIITDTNCFTSLTTTAKTHLIVNELLNYKFDDEKLKSHYFKNISLEKTKLLAKALNSLKIIKNTSTAIMKLTYEDMQRLGTSFEDTLGIIDNGISVEGVNICAIFIEKEPNFIYVSLRGMGNYNVGEIAAKFFGGGSNKCAAFQYIGQLKDIEKEFTDYIKEKIKIVDNSGGDFDFL